MSIQSPLLAMSVCLSTALLAGCADGGSSATHAAGTVPVTPQGSASVMQASSGRQAHSGVRRTLSAPTCSGTGSGAFVGGPGSAMYGLNVAAGEYTVVGGGENNQACDALSTIAGGAGNAVSGTGGPEDGFIGGGQENVVTGDSQDSAVVGGAQNTVSTNDSAIVGGRHNSVAGAYSVVGGGGSNGITSAASYAAIVSGYSNTLLGEYGFIGDGSSNTVSGSYGVIGGGNTNNVSGTAAVIGGGQGSLAEGAYAMVPGGYYNNAAGELSFAAGYHSYARYAGSFVWSDYTSGATLLESTGVNQFLARATGGFTLWTNAANTVGATLAPGSGTWASASDRNLKTDVARVDDAAVLDKVAALPIERWSYKSERGVRHVGPMAQDFYAAFGVGEDDKHITSIDENGVALAAIKALHAENADAHTAISTLRAQNARLTALTATQSSQIARLSAEVASIHAEIRAKR